MAQFKTLQFPNTPWGQAEKVRRLQLESANGWRVVSETIVPGKFKGGKACCLFLIFAPCAFLAGHEDDVINVTLANDDVTDHLDHSNPSRPAFDRKKWDALVQYDKEVAVAAGQVRALGQKWVDELATAYLTLNDNRYLPEILAKITERAHAEQAEVRSRLASEEAKRQAALHERERVAQTRRDQHQFWYDHFWGTSDRRLRTLGALGVLVLLVALLNWQAGTPPDSETPPKPIASADRQTIEAAPAQPSFDCGKVHSQVLKLVCATPDLAKEDQRLAEVYQIAIANSASPRALKQSERAWILRRNRALADVGVLRAMYEARIVLLENIDRNIPLGAGRDSGQQP